MRRIFLAASTAIFLQPISAIAAPASAIHQAFASPKRSDANRARDKYRHPAQTLTFYGVKPGSTGKAGA